MIISNPCTAWDINLSNKNDRENESMKKRPLRLLTKTTSVYLVFTFLAFFASAHFLTREADAFIDQELENRFGWGERRIERHINRHPELGQVHPTTFISIYDRNTADGNYPIYIDTVMLNPEQNELQPFRKKIMLYKNDDQLYRVEIVLPTNDFMRLRDDIFEALIPAFIFLAIAIVLFNTFLSGYFFRPFNQILNQMKTFRMGEGRQTPPIQTDTTEFMRMQDLFRSMTCRIDRDYKNLKEYTENMAHEIQTPLTIIRNKSENLIADEMVMDRRATDVKTIYEETNQLSRLGNTLNLLTKIENREFNQTVHLRTRQVIEKHVEAICESARLKELTIETRLAEGHYLMIDPFLFDILIKNLLRNAIRYGTPEGPITVVTEKKSMRFQNYGPPLTGNADKIFKRFHSDPASKTSLGLGLSIVQRICELNDLTVIYTYADRQHIFSISELD